MDPGHVTISDQHTAGADCPVCRDVYANGMCGLVRFSEVNDPGTWPLFGGLPVCSSEAAPKIVAAYESLGVQLTDKRAATTDHGIDRCEFTCIGCGETERYLATPEEAERVAWKHRRCDHGKARTGKHKPIKGFRMRWR